MGVISFIFFYFSSIDNQIESVSIIFIKVLFNKILLFPQILGRIRHILTVKTKFCYLFEFYVDQKLFSIDFKSTI